MVSFGLFGKFHVWVPNLVGFWFHHGFVKSRSHDEVIGAAESGFVWCVPVLLERWNFDLAIVGAEEQLQFVFVVSFLQWLTVI